MNELAKATKVPTESSIHLDTTAGLVKRLEDLAERIENQFAEFVTPEAPLPPGGLVGGVREAGQVAGSQSAVSSYFTRLEECNFRMNQQILRIHRMLDRSVL